ncbi:MAG: 3-hydroxyacyl-[acyl-carrier-protein] dehydratase FabZ [Candidatus Eisenbacteria bacterium]|nr:3-hydroxyacyl-[acyl-carrier-protein] dehydratase FabZ [Candidatus Eisenbacteria bacterium]
MSDSVVPLDADAIRALLPLRHPYLLIDRVISVFPGGCIALKHITFSDPSFVGHFPEKAVYPGSLLMESMAQSGYFMGTPEDATAPDRTAYRESFLVSANLKFHRPAVPGDQILLRARLVRQENALVHYKVDAHVGAALIASGTFGALLRVATSEEHP